MNATADPQAFTRPIDRWFASYSADHHNATNQKIHYVAVPLILWTATALLWCIPVPGTLFHAGFWCALAMFAAWSFYYRASRPLGFGMLAVFIAMAWFNRWLYLTIGGTMLLKVAIAVFVIAWIAQFVGHKIEGKKPSFLTDLVYLLIGPAWVLAKAFRAFGLKF
jgi:uncharacterized membrane protein YGL010W